MEVLADRFVLCKTCLKRQGGPQPQFRLGNDRNCFICRGLASKAKTDSLARRMIRSLKGYEFNSFSIGLILPSGIQEREDRFHSELKIRGRETLKAQLAREICKELSESTGRDIDRLRPDLTILIDLNKLSVHLTTKPLFLYGRYTKPRGVPQRRSFCQSCRGRGCDACANTGYDQLPSVESVVARKLAKAMGSKRTKFTWLGSEDAESEVLPPEGRPFVAELKNPKKRTSPRRLSLRTGKGRVTVSNLKVLPGRPTRVPSFVFKTAATIESPRRIGDEELKKLGKEMVDALVQFQTDRGKFVYKKVHSMRARRGVGNKIIADIKMDGGLPVKRLVSGESVSPSFSEFLKTPLSCRRFDIVRVWERGKFEFAT